MFSIDPQKFCICPCDAKYKGLSAHFYAEIAVGNATAQRDGFQIAGASPLRNPRKRFFQC
jgi:hypothetical protein